MMVNLFVISILMLLFFAKHYIADYPLQDYYRILGLLHERKSQVMSMVVHGSIHAAFTASIFFGATFFMGDPLLLFPLLLGLMDGVAHGAIDFVVLRAGKDTGYTLQNRTFVNVFGFDQMLHHLTHLGLIVLFLIMI